MYLNTPWDYHYSSLDGRSILDRLASVKYFAIKKADMGICHTAMTVKQKSQKIQDLRRRGFPSSWLYL